jgi:hypothetical protein
LITDWFRSKHHLAVLLDAQREELREYGKAFDVLSRSVRRSRDRSANLAAEVKTLRRQLADANEQLAVRSGIGLAVWPPFTRAQTEAIDDHARDKRNDDGIGDN